MLTSYSEMSKFEINVKVAKKRGMLVKTEFDKGRSGFTKSYHDRYPDTVWAAHCENGVQTEPWEQFCFTNDWEDAGPIIEKYSIALTPIYSVNKQGSWTLSRWICTTVGDVEAESKKPLRAAMEVFLMIEDGL